MAKHPQENSFRVKFFTKVYPLFIDLGASVVILGALFKLLNLPGGSFMLGLGLSTEALIFGLGVFRPADKEYQWENVFPELIDVSNKTEAMRGTSLQPVDMSSYHEQMARMTETLAHMNNLYATELAKITERLHKSNALYTEALQTMEDMQQASAEVAGFKIQLVTLRERLAALNTVYENTLNALRG